MRETALFVDLDNTLIQQVPLTSYPPFRKQLKESRLELMNADVHQLESMLDGDASIAITEKGRVVVEVRPGARDFLKEVRELFDALFCLTAGQTEHQSQVMETAGLAQMFDNVYGRDMYARVPSFDQAVLVDDLPIDHPNCRKKLKAMGVISGDRKEISVRSSFIKVTPWYGTFYKGGEDGRSLKKVLVELKKSNSDRRKTAAWIVGNCHFAGRDG